MEALLVVPSMGQNSFTTSEGAQKEIMTQRQPSESYFPWAVALHKWGVCSRPSARRSIFPLPWPASSVCWHERKVMGMFTSDPVSFSFCTCLWKKTVSLWVLLVKAVPTVGLLGEVAWWHRPNNFVKNFASNPVPGVLGSCVAVCLLVGHCTLLPSLKLVVVPWALTCHPKQMESQYVALRESISNNDIASKYCMSLISGRPGKTNNQQGKYD